MSHKSQKQTCYSYHHCLLLVSLCRFCCTAPINARLTLMWPLGIGMRTSGWSAILPIFVFGACSWDIGLSFSQYPGINNRLSILQIFVCGVCLADISVSKISLYYVILGILGIVYLPIHSFHIYTPQVVVCIVFCCRAGEALSNKSRIAVWVLDQTSSQHQRKMAKRMLF